MQDSRAAPPPFNVSTYEFQWGQAAGKAMTEEVESAELEGLVNSIKTLVRILYSNLQDKGKLILLIKQGNGII